MRCGDALFRLATSAGLVCAMTACEREERRFQGSIYNQAGITASRRDRPGASPPVARGEAGPYAKNAWGMSEGQRLYGQMNCVGCHAHGGGGMGPALMDGNWIYGADDAAIFTSIVDGRPGGMPAFRGRLSDDQAWQLVAYVKSVGGYASAAVAPVRDDHMALTPGPARVSPQPIVEYKP
jgi:cytochrome c oxidase cbb3-type subunit III